jgi:histone deacetylase 11
VIYNAGTDVLRDDPLGSLRMSPETVIKRDERVIEMCIQSGAPVMMVLSGGYHEKCAKVIAESIANLLSKFP